MVQPIQNEEQYAAALGQVESLKQQQLLPGSPESDELEMLMVLIALFEKKGAIVFLKDGKEYVNEFYLDFAAA